MPSKKPKVVVGMSGGVDSSVAAYLLKQQGYDVIGVFMNNWLDQPAAGRSNSCCTAERDFSDVKRVCEVLDIPYYAVDFSEKYMDNVFKIFLDGLKHGITPNPDILCNREIKFGPFLEFADKIGADFIATGHYARGGADGGRLLRAADSNKDQTYFLCALAPKQLSRVLFPLGGIQKTEVRALAKKLGLVTAAKKDSTGICFIGERKFREFMQTYLGNQPGEIKTLDGKTVGRHTGLMYYTIGQRRGLGQRAQSPAGGSANAERLFVVRKDLASNTLYVGAGASPELYSRALITRNFNWLAEFTGGTLSAKTRYRQPDQPCTAEILPNGDVRVTFKKPVRAVTPGQWVVLYDGEVCLGGGEISETL